MRVADEDEGGLLKQPALVMSLSDQLQPDVLPQPSQT